MSRLENEKYKSQFGNLDPFDVNYIDNFIELIESILKERNSFVKSTGDDKNRKVFFTCLKGLLIELGVKNKMIEFLTSGHSSLAFKIDDKVLKIGKATWDLSPAKQFSCTVPVYFEKCQMIGEHEYYTLQLTQYVDVDKISEEELYSVYKELRKLGYIWNDPTIENVGKIIEDLDYNGIHYAEGSLVVVDLEDMSYVGEVTPDVVLDWLCYEGYNRKAYIYEERYTEEKNNILN
ncbi:MAG: hypothetical protein IJR82_05330 [Bacilli bacterium]|nr:hypothetical protein [Bacilli bacterium]